MDYDSVAKIGSMLGSGGTVIMDEDTCMVDVARRIMHFYAHESCGWCIPCREGTAWLRKMLDRFHEGGGREEDIPLIDELSKNMLGRTFCPLGDAAALPDDQHREKVAQRIRGSSARQVRVQARRDTGGRALADLGEVWHWPANSGRRVLEGRVSAARHE